MFLLHVAIIRYLFQNAKWNLLKCYIRTYCQSVAVSQNLLQNLIMSSKMYLVWDSVLLGFDAVWLSECFPPLLCYIDNCLPNENKSSLPDFLTLRWYGASCPTVSYHSLSVTSRPTVSYHSLSVTALPTVSYHSLSVTALPTIS